MYKSIGITPLMRVLAKNKINIILNFSDASDRLPTKPRVHKTRKNIYTFKYKKKKKKEMDIQ